MRRIGLAILMAALSMNAGSANEPVLLHAAGSLRGALTEISQAFQQQLVKA
jgi:ABC-type molybdate transport system substrate-binding protein